MTFIIGTPHTHNCGNATWVNGGRDMRQRQADVQTCPHCQATLDMQIWASAGVQNFCNRCMKPTCDRKACVTDCFPYVKRAEAEIERIERRLGFCRAAGLDPHDNLILLPV